VQRLVVNQRHLHGKLPRAGRAFERLCVVRMKAHVRVDARLVGELSVADRAGEHLLAAVLDQVSLQRFLHDETARTHRTRERPLAGVREAVSLKVCLRGELLVALGAAVRLFAGVRGEMRFQRVLFGERPVAPGAGEPPVAGMLHARVLRQRVLRRELFRANGAIEKRAITGMQRLRVLVQRALGGEAAIARAAVEGFFASMSACVRGQVGRPAKVLGANRAAVQSVVAAVVSAHVQVQRALLGEHSRTDHAAQRSRVGRRLPGAGPIRLKGFLVAS